MKHKTVAVDLAKNVFEIAVSDQPGQVSQQKRLPRSRFLHFFATLEPLSFCWKPVGRPISGAERYASSATRLSCCPHTWSVPIVVVTSMTVPTPKLSLRLNATRRSSRFPSRRSSNRFLLLCIDFARAGRTPARLASMRCEAYCESSAFSFPSAHATWSHASTSWSKTPSQEFPML